MELFGPKSGRRKAPVLAINTLSSCHKETWIHFKTRSSLCSSPTLQEEGQAATSLLALVKPCKASSFRSCNRQKFTGDLRVWGKYFHWRKLTQSFQHAIGLTFIHIAAPPCSSGEGGIQVLPEPCQPGSGSFRWIWCHLGGNYDVLWHMINCHWVVFTLLVCFSLFCVYYLQMLLLKSSQRLRIGYTFFSARRLCIEMYVIYLQFQVHLPTFYNFEEWYVVID